MNVTAGVELPFFSVPSKIFCKVITQRITKAVDDVLRNEQAGFRKGCRCVDQIFTLRNILEHVLNGKGSCM